MARIEIQTSSEKYDCVTWNRCANDYMNPGLQGHEESAASSLNGQSLEPL